MTLICNIYVFVKIISMNFFFFKYDNSAWENRCHDSHCNFFLKVSGKLHIAEFKFLLFIFGGKIYAE